MGGDSWSRGREFESLHRILDGKQKGALDNVLLTKDIQQNMR